MTGNVLTIRGLSKSFRRKRAVDQVDITVSRGEITGFLGPNGAGKTTVMNIVMGLVGADAGEIELLGVRDGFRRRDVRSRIGFLQEKPRIYPDMTARAYLHFFAGLYDVGDEDQRVGEVLERVGLSSVRGRLGTFSRGMQQRACLARVLLHRPEFLILDEPTLGLDPNGMADMRAIFREMKGQGVTLLFSSHQLAEMERICDSVIFMRQGKVIASGRQVDLMPVATARGAVSVELFEPVRDHTSRIALIEGIASVCERATNHLELTLTNPPADARHARAEVARLLALAGVTVLAITVTVPTLEDLFIGLTGADGAGPALVHHQLHPGRGILHGTRI
ncbi:ABC transporter ATP-binding protein [Ensifer sp. YR511]|uniref:ABC transporter ATP-binding protein n=1 Tax=Ensifer sp. YR511 TaxID=1855294 RepID=UPI000890268F|nr:ABC transporter ATP-binding protein [Ensifer sp. YR511]SDN03921.1 ABC-2 type transport system ATP-binding protein [Ensifer sp. YR511]